MFRIELIFRWPKISFPGDWDFISVIRAVASRLSLWDNEEEGPFELLLEFFKQFNYDGQELITSDVLVEVSSSIKWSRASEDSSKKNNFSDKNLLTLFINFWPSSDFPVSCKWILSFHKYSVVIRGCSIN